MAATSNDRSELEKAIAEHLTKHGAGDWATVQARFPDVSHSTFWRHVRKFKKDMGALAPDAQRVLKEVQRAKDHLPISVAPATIIEHGPEKIRANIDYYAQLEEAVNVADMLRDYSLNGDGKVRIPAYLRDSAKLRLDAVKTGVSVLTLLSDIRRMENFFQAVVEEVGKVSPEAQRAIMDRLQALNREYGMTAAAFI